MPVDVKSEKLTRLVDEAVEVERLGTGFTFTEGPIWHPRDEHLLFSDMPADIRRKWTPDGTRRRGHEPEQQVQRDDL